MNIYFLIFWATLTYLDFSDYLAVLYGRNFDMHSLNCKWNTFLFEFDPFFKILCVLSNTQTRNRRTEWYNSRLWFTIWWKPSCRLPFRLHPDGVCKDFKCLKGSVGRKLHIVKELRERGSSKHCYMHDECLTSKSDLNENNKRPYTCLYVRLYVYMHHHLCGISFMLHSATYQTLTLCGFRQSEW